LIDDAAAMAVPPIDLQLPDGRALDAPEHGHLSPAVNSVPRVVVELIAGGR
jgi:hypothetical protein